MFSNNPIILSISNWFHRNFSDPEAVSLFFMVLFGFLFFEFFGGFFAPITISIVIAYLLTTPVRYLLKLKVPHGLAVTIVYVIFLSLVVFLLVILLPSLWKQLLSMAIELPKAFTASQSWFIEIQQKYPIIFSDTQLGHVMSVLKVQSSRIGQWVVSYSVSSLPGLFQLMLYLVLVPLLLFFFLMDRRQIIGWLGQYMPKHKGLITKVWSELNVKIGAYIRGRVIEVVLVGTVSSIAFSILSLDYAVLLGCIFGISALIPYIGGILATIPIVIIGLMQWGFSMSFVYLLVTYFVILILDANILVPVFFGGVMDIHPIVIILSVIIFGGLWGFWGVFFAIPLATLVNVILKAWPIAED